MVQQEKAFFDVFPEFNCPDEFRNLFNNVSVRDVVLSKSKKLLKIYINSKILIPKNIIYKMEDSLSSYLFQNHIYLKNHYRFL